MFHYLYKAMLADICCLCDTSGLPGLDLCHSCHKSLPHNHHFCHRCAAPLVLAATAEAAPLCGQCLTTPTDIDDSIIPFLYRPPIDYLIKQLKFREQIKFSHVLGTLLADAIEHRHQAHQHPQSPDNSNELPSVIMPMPMHSERLLQRGFNQAEQIAKSVAQRFGRQYDTQSVIRSPSGTTQTRLNAKQREANIRRAFTVVNPSSVEGKHVAVVDDVYTTGATARAIARRLKHAHASRVSIWAVARTP